MSLVVDFRISGELIEMTRVAAAVPDVTLELQEWRPAGETVLWFLWARGADLDRVTEEFRALSHAAEVTVVNDAGSVRLYRVSIHPNIEIPPDDMLADGTLTQGYIEPDCLRLTGRVSGRDVLTGVWNYLRERDIDVTVDSLRRAVDEDHDRRLTDSQFEALVTAYEMGYFDESKRVTHSEIADELGISRSSLSERLRRAEHELVQERLGASD